MATLILRTLAERPVTLPLASQRAVQGLIYGALREASPALADAVHNEGASFENRQFKFFTFSRLRAHSEVVGRTAVYTGRGKIEIRTPDTALADCLQRVFSSAREISLLQQPLTLEAVERADVRLRLSDTLLRMVTPLTVHVHGEGSFIRFFSPDEPEFAQMVSANYRRKASAFWGREALEPIELEAVQTLPKDCCMTTFKGTVIRAYYGVYRLRGTPDALDFLYQTGLGARNSQGFGMFDPIGGAEAEALLARRARSPERGRG